MLSKIAKCYKILKNRKLVNILLLRIVIPRSFKKKKLFIYISGLQIELSVRALVSLYHAWPALRLSQEKKKDSCSSRWNNKQVCFPVINSIIYLFIISHLLIILTPSSVYSVK